MKDEVSALKAQVRELTFLHETSQVLTASLDLDDVLRSIMTQVRDYFQVEAASVALLEEETGDLVFRVAVGQASKEVVGLRMRPGEGIAGWVFQTGQPELVPVAHADERFYTGVDDSTDFRTHTMLAVPVKVEGRAIGVIEALNPAAGAFDADAQRLLLAVADLAAVAINNAALYERVWQAERRYESLFCESTDPIVVLDLDGRILDFNHRVVELLGRAREQLDGVDFCDVLGMNREQCRLAIQQIRRDQYLKVEMRLQMPAPSSEDLLILETTMAKINYGGRDAIQWVGHDVSERVALEQMREDLTHMIVHDLRNPLGSMMSGLQLVQNALIEGDSSLPLVKLLSIAMRGGRKMFRLIDSLLDLGRMEAGEMDLKRTMVSPAALAQDAIEQVHPTVLSRDQTLTAEIASDLPEVLADADLMLRVVANLIDNAVKFSPVGGQITVRVERVGEEVRFAVTDSGPGIPPESRQRIFDRFVRLEGIEDVKGTGIGLAFCKLAVEAHEGRIWVESEVGRGATFYFALPLEAGVETRPSSLEAE